MSNGPTNDLYGYFLDAIGHDDAMAQDEARRFSQQLMRDIHAGKIVGVASKTYDGTTCWLCDKCKRTRDGRGCRTCDANEITRLRALVRSAYEEGLRTGEDEERMSLYTVDEVWEVSSARRALSGE